ncbi:MAG: ATP-binding protein [Solirubrobacteraceae bacterium]
MPVDTPALPGTEHHPHARAVLGAALAPTGHPSHAYLFHGPAGTGKRTAARAFAATLLAEGAANPDAARARAQRGAHPDLTWVVPSGAHELLVSDVDTPVVSAAARTPFEAARRVFVIERADTMNDEAGNRMLKTLEEPAPFVHLVLLTDRPGEVMPTIASRCQHVRFDPLPVDEIARRLERDHAVDPTTARACARLALGADDRAVRLATGEGPSLRAAAERFARAGLAGEMESRPWLDLRAQARRRGEAAVAELDEAHERRREYLDRRERRRAETEHAERVRRVRRRAETEALDLGLSVAGLWYRDLACAAWGAPELACNCDRESELAADGRHRDPQRLRAAVELVEDTRQRLTLNVAEELACEALGYRLEEALGGRE